MENIVYRPARSGDMDDIIFNWHLCFGDPEAFPRRLLSHCGLLKNALVADCGGRVVCSLLLFPGLKFGGNKACYLYALCTHPDYGGRGIGSGLCAFAAQRCRADGHDMLLLRPGDENLERWYGRMGYVPLWRYGEKKLDISGISAPEALKISPGEYLSALPETCPATAELIAAQNALQQLCGGAFLRVENSLLCAEYDGTSLRIRHALSPEASLLPAAAAAGKFFGTDSVYLLRRDDNDGDAALMALPLQGQLPPLPEDLFFPFTMD